MLKLGCERIVSGKEYLLTKNVALLDALSPLAVLGRGYTITMKDDSVISDETQLNVGDCITTRFKNITAVSKVTEVKKNG